MTTGTAQLAYHKTSSEPVGDEVFVIGHPRGDYKSVSYGVLSGSILSTYSREYDMMSSNYTEPGESGGPVFDSDDGYAIGIFVCGFAPGLCIDYLDYGFTKWSYVSSKIGRYLSPRIPTPVVYIQTITPEPVNIGQAFTVELRSNNYGSWTSTEGAIHVAFPDFTSSADSSRVSVLNGSSDLVCTPYSAGYNGLYRRDGSVDTSAAYFHLECVDSSWSQNELNSITLSVQPKATGTFRLLCRSTMSGEHNYYYSAPGSSGVTDTDQQWPMNQYDISVVQEKPAVTTQAASSLGQTSATLNALVNPNGASTTAYYDYGTSPASLTNAVTYGSVGSGTSNVSAPKSVTGLSCGTTYYFRARASSTGGSTNGSTLQFPTTACPQPPPSVATQPATSITQTSATLNALVNPNGASTTAYYDYGTSPASLTSTVTYGSIGSGTSNVSAPKSVTGLNCGTTYYFRARASSTGGSNNGSTLQFSTTACPQPPPSVATQTATSITQASATLNALVNPNGASTTAYYDYGTSPASLTSTVTYGSVGSGTSNVSAPKSVTGLSCGATYYFRARASSTGGSTNGSTLQFPTTACSPGSFTLSITSAGTGSGTVTSNPAGINCGTDCSQTYNSGTTVTLTPTPASGSTFAGWTGSSDCADGIVTMNTNLSCTANFNLSASSLLINEVYGGTPDYLEIANAGSSTVQLSGYSLIANGCGSTSAALPSFLLPPGSYVRVNDNTGSPTGSTVFLGTNLCWNQDAAGSLALLSGSNAIDFVRWGGSTTPPLGGTSWSGASAPAPTGSGSIGRSLGAPDSDDAADWCAQTQSAPGPNSTCNTELIFSDGFESGDTSSWSSTQGPPACNAQGVGTIDLAGGTLAGQSLSGSWTITVQRNATIAGTANATTTNFMGSNAVAPFGYTWTWGNRSTSIATVSGWIPTGSSNWSIPISLTAPSSPGTYYILFGFNGEFDMSQVLSCSNWASGSVVWNDGNDYFDMAPAALAFASQCGYVDEWSYKFSSGYQPRDVPTMPIKVVVTN